MKKGGRRIWKWAGEKAETKIQERADWKKNLEPWGGRTSQMHGRLRHKSAVRKRDALDETRENKNTICGARASNKEERRGVIKMTLDQACKRFLYTPAGKDRLGKKSEDPRMAILRSQLSRTRKAARQPFFLRAIKHRGATQLSRDATAQDRSARRSPWHPNLKRKKNRRRTWGRYMQPRVIFYGERLLPRKKLTTLISSRKQGEKTAWQQWVGV